MNDGQNLCRAEGPPLIPAGPDATSTSTHRRTDTDRPPPEGVSLRLAIPPVYGERGGFLKTDLSFFRHEGFCKMQFSVCPATGVAGDRTTELF